MIRQLGKYPSDECFIGNNTIFICLGLELSNLNCLVNMARAGKCYFIINRVLLLRDQGEMSIFTSELLRSKLKTMLMR